MVVAYTAVNKCLRGSCGDMNRFVAIKIEPCLQFFYSHILFAVEGRNVPLPLVNLLREGGPFVLVEAYLWVSPAWSGAAF